MTLIQGCHQKIPEFFFFWVMALWKFGHFNLVSKISQKVFERLETWLSDRDDKYVSYLTFEKIPKKFSSVIAFWKFGHFNLVSKISKKLDRLIGNDEMMTWSTFEKVRVMVLWKFGHFNLVSKISRKQFKLLPWSDTLKGNDEWMTWLAFEKFLKFFSWVWPFELFCI